VIDAVVSRSRRAAMWRPALHRNCSWTLLERWQEPGGDRCGQVRGEVGGHDGAIRVGFAQVAFGVDAEWTDRIRRPGAGSRTGASSATN
jgi:hypothetical protein